MAMEPIHWDIRWSMYIPITDLQTFVLYICGDFNARCGNKPDTIEGVDNVEDRHDWIILKTNMVRYSVTS